MKSVQSNPASPAIPKQTGSKVWSFNDLSNIRQMIDGDDLFQSVSPETTGPQLTDAVVLNPSGENLFRSVSIDLGASLKDQGVQVQERLDGVGVAVKLTPEKMQELKEQGFKVIDDSPRNLLPAFPSTTTSTTAATGSTTSSSSTSATRQPLPPQALKALPSTTWSLPVTDAVSMMHSQGLSGRGANGQGEVVAILDSGFDLPNLATSVVAYHDFTASQSSEFHDGAGHGSHVAQQVLAVAPQAKLLVGKVMGDKGEGRPSDILKGLQWVAQMHDQGTNISVCNLSLGEQVGASPEMMQAIHEQIHRLSNDGVKVVAAVGNSGPNPGSITSPADSLDTIAVGSVLNPSVVSEFSGRGQSSGPVRPDVVAPGEYIAGEAPPYSQLYRNAAGIQKLRDMEPQKLQEFVQARPQLLDAFGLSQDLLNESPYKLEQELKRALPPTGLVDGKVLAQGTSFSAPLTSGLIASLDTVKDLSTEQTRELLQKTAHHIDGYPPYVQGAGLVDAQKALDQLAKS